MPYQLRSAAAGAPGQRPQRQFINGVTRFFFTQLDKGVGSPFVLLSAGLIISYVSWRLALRWESTLVQSRQLQPASSTSQSLSWSGLRMSAMHNAHWGLGGAAQNENVPFIEEEHSVISRDPQNITPEMEERLTRPHLVHSEPSELHSAPTAHNPRGELDLVCLELTEYDPARQGDVYYRSVHYVEPDIEPGKGTPDKETRDTKKNDKSSPSKSVNSYETQGYFSRLPAHGTQVIHGMVKCRDLSAQNNCIPVAGHVEQESARKLLLSLGPSHLLRNAFQRLLPFRISQAKQVYVRTLVLGLHGGELPRCLARAFPNYDVDVVEADGALVRLCRRFCGLQESHNLHLHLANPVDYVRFLAAGAQDKKNSSSSKRAEYDLVLIDAVDGMGRLNTAYGRLDFIHHIRTSMSSRGCVALTIPNRDAGFVYNLVQNWRLAFHDRTVLLIHCATAPCTILMTFQDNAPAGQVKIGSVVSVDEFRDLLRAQEAYYGAGRLPFDLSSEVNADNFRIFAPGETYKMEHYLPQGHPALLAAAAAEAAGQRRSGPALLALYLKTKLQHLASVI